VSDLKLIFCIFCTA